MPTIQATTIGGKPVARAKWEVKSLGGFSVGHAVHVNVPVDDAQLLKAIAKAPRGQGMIETEEDGHSVTLTFSIERFTHMLGVDPGSDGAELDSMAWIKPVDRTTEAVLLYVYEPESCDPRFAEAVRAKPVRDSQKSE